MLRWQKFSLIAVGIAALVFICPIVYAYLRPRTLAGVYDGDSGITCMCGHTQFHYIDATGYYEFVPGHRHKKLLYKLQEEQPGEWIALRGGTNVCRFRFDAGEVYRTFPRNTNWFKEDRVYNLWRIWVPQILAE